MVGHEAAGMADPVMALINALEGIEEVLAVFISLKNGRLLIPAGGHRIDCAGLFNTEGAGHNSAKLSEHDGNVDLHDVTLICAVLQKRPESFAPPAFDRCFRSPGHGAYRPVHW
jgi:hypothetical protein